jgi:hypothetical protein
MTLAPVAAKSNPNLIQTSLIPEESRNVRYLMIKAKDFSSSENPLVAHLIPAILAAGSVALSAINALSYLLQAPIKILLNIVQFRPLGFFVDFAQDLTNLARSLLFVSLGATLIVAGILFPKPIFTHFAPEYYESLPERLKHERDQKIEETKNLGGEIGRLDMLNRDQTVIRRQDFADIEELTAENKKLKQENEQLKKNLNVKKSWQFPFWN